MKFIELTGNFGKRFILNADKIDTVHEITNFIDHNGNSDKEIKSLIYIGDDSYYVKESYHDISILLEAEWS